MSHQKIMSQQQNVTQKLYVLKKSLNIEWHKKCEKQFLKKDNCHKILIWQKKEIVTKREVSQKLKCPKQIPHTGDTESLDQSE